MRQIALFLFTLAFAGCANHLITSDIFENNTDYFSYINTTYKGDEIEIHFLNDSIHSGKLVEIERDSIYLDQYASDSSAVFTNAYTIKDVHQLKYIRSQRLEGFLIGAGAGMITGAVLEPFSFSTNSGKHVESGPNYFGMGGVGGIIGMAIGNSAEKEIVLLINPK